MKRIISIAIAVLMLFSFSSCSGDSDKTSEKSIKSAKSLADLKGAKISAQTGTFHADALTQIKDVKSSLYPEFADLLTALKSGAIDGYIAEEPTALSACLEDNTLSYIALKNNATGFTAKASDVGVAVGLKTGSALRDKINDILKTIPEETKSELMKQAVDMAAGKDVAELALKSDAPAKTNGTLKVAMECAYKPFNWTETGAKTNGAIQISGEGKKGLFANGYDVQISQYIANKLGMKLEVYSMKWDSLLPALNSGNVDAIIAGMSPTEEREKQIDFTNTYYESNLVVIIKK